MLEPRSYDGAREARQVDNFFRHLKRYFEAFDINDEEEKVQTTVTLRIQLPYESAEDTTMINLRWLRPKGNIREYVKEYLALMLKILEMSERQRLCFFIDGLQQWFATEFQRKEPHDLASAMVIVERLEDFKQRERPRSPRHKSKEEVAKGKKSKKRRDLFYTTVDVAKKTQEALVDTGATHNFISPRIVEWLGLKSTKDESWITAVDDEEPLTKRVRTGKADINIIAMDELGVVLGTDFMEKSSATLNPY
ncbi:hypothetical protein RJ639_015664 [Escallonia herrerae]|uniref:Retrotransposon gag domain-containing protein n=1 Tax=Escallonia herrerae TaxID=1293975 RepID=A0AA88VHL1_9ASTE|nr:hypothetical protein RJ639_015664 [Escallonia herrerae]